MNVRSSLLDLALNIIIPYAIYALSKQYLHASDITALTYAAGYPLFDTFREYMQDHTLNVISSIVLLSTLAGIIGALLGGNTQILLIRESFFTFLLGIACLVSLFFGKPILFYFAREYVAGKDPKKRQEFGKVLHRPQAFRLFKTLTLVWGVIYVLEFGLKIILVTLLSVPQVLILGPISIYGITIIAIVWTFWYSKRARQKMENNKQKK